MLLTELEKQITIENNYDEPDIAELIDDPGIPPYGWDEEDEEVLEWTQTTVRQFLGFWFKIAWQNVNTI